MEKLLIQVFIVVIIGISAFIGGCRLGQNDKGVPPPSIIEVEKIVEVKVIDEEALKIAIQKKEEELTKIYNEKVIEESCSIVINENITLPDGTLIVREEIISGNTNTKETTQTTTETQKQEQEDIEQTTKIEYVYRDKISTKEVNVNIYNNYRLGAAVNIGTDFKIDSYQVSLSRSLTKNIWLDSFLKAPNTFSLDDGYTFGVGISISW